MLPAVGKPGVGWGRGGKQVNQARERVVVLGPGAMGCLFAALLKKGGADVWLLDKRPERARLLSGRGIVLERGGVRETVPVPVTADPAAAGPARLLIVCVKAYDTAAAAGLAAGATGPETLLLSLQNGVGNVEALVEVFGRERTLGGTTAQGANLAAPGHVRHAGVGETVIGQPGGGLERAAYAAGLLVAAGIEARVTEDLDAVIWSKLTINAAINPLTAILRVRNGALAEDENARALMRAAAEETAAVAAARGIQLLYPDPFAKVLAVAEATAENISSMHQDARAKRRTEIDQIGGAVAAEAERLGVRAPVNRALALLIKALEASYNKMV